MIGEIGIKGGAESEAPTAEKRSVTKPRARSKCSVFLMFSRDDRRRRSRSRSTSQRSRSPDHRYSDFSDEDTRFKKSKQSRKD